MIYSPFPETYFETVKIATDLKGIDNGIIKIYEVRIEALENGNEEIQIEYDFQGTARVKKYEVIKLTELNREIVLRFIPMK